MKDVIKGNRQKRSTGRGVKKARIHFIGGKKRPLKQPAEWKGVVKVDVFKEKTRVSEKHCRNSGAENSKVSGLNKVTERMKKI